MYTLEPDGQLVFRGGNPAGDRLLGIDHDQLVGRTIEEAFPALAATDIPARYRAIAAGGPPWNADQVVYQDERVAGAFEVHAFHTAPGQMTVMFMDVTERRRA
jgi:PAS domain-containing protein